MKRVLLFTLLISFIGYSQNPIQPNTPNFEDGFPQDLVEKMKPINLEFGDDEMMDFNPTKKRDLMEPQSFQRVVMVQNENDISYRLDKWVQIKFIFDFLTFKDDKLFDQNGNLTQDITYRWETESQSFVPISKYEYSYDENGNRTLYIRYDSYDSQSFVPRSKYEYTFDDNGHKTREVNYSWNTESQSFIISYKDEYTYNENGILTTTRTNWDIESQSWFFLGKSENTFDENGNQTLSINYLWSSESQSFVPSMKFERSFDENGNQTLYIDYYWNSESQSLVPNRKYEHSYDENGNQTLQINYNWNLESQSFVSNVKHEYTFDENGNRTLSIYYNWDSESQSFVPSSKRETSYDENGNQTLYIYYDWNTGSQSFVPEGKSEYTIGENNFYVNLKSYIWDSAFEVFKPGFRMDVSTISETETNLVREGITYEYDTNFNTWIELEGEEFKSYWYYTKESSLSTNSVEPNSFSIYPNPTKGNLNINSSESLTNPIIELYDVKGSKIFSKPFNFSEPIDVSGLKPSIYLYKIIDGNEVKQSGKVIKE